MNTSLMMLLKYSKALKILLFPYIQIDLSYNRVPFVTSKMFPEHKWIPYRLEHLDLSHNNMPVITKDMLVGTKHLKYLNISYNILTDIRKGRDYPVFLVFFLVFPLEKNPHFFLFYGVAVIFLPSSSDVLSNMSSLEVLSMSGNKLEDKIFLADGHSFGFLPNLTVLELDRNKFTQLPIEELILHQKLKTLNLAYNQLTKYSPELTEMVKKGLKVEYEGNQNKYIKPT